MDMKRVLSFLGAVVVGLAMAACDPGGETENPNDRLEAEVANIDSYLSSKGIAAVKDQSGVRLVIYKLGSGFPAKLANTVSVDYEGRLFPDGISFDQGTTKKPLGSYIDGWKIAFSILPEGSRARLYIPSAWGYGPSGTGTTIPGNAPLEFDVNFKELVRTGAELQRLATDTIAIDTYLSNKGITDVVKVDTTGLRYVVTTLGTGAIPSLYSKLKFTLTYKLLTDDTKAVATTEWEPTATFDSRAVDQNADGVKKVLSSVPAGSKVTAYLPSLLAFGASGAKDNGVEVIPANANIIVEIDLREIVNP